MDNLPDEVQDILSDFGTCCSHSVWLNACVLVIGAILCIGKRTVTSALRVMGLKDDKRFTNFHRVLNRAKWCSLTCSRILLGKLIKLVPEDWPLLFIVDETIERRSGPEIKAKGCYRDAVRSTEKTVVKCFGLKWISMMLVAKLPWSERVWALPFLTVLAPSKACNESENKRHKTTVDWTCQMIMQVSRWFPNREMILIGDGGYAALKLGHCCSGLKNKVTLVSRLRLDAGLYDFPPQPQPGKRGPKPKKGKKQPTLADRVKDASTKWNLITVRWYDGVERKLEFFSGESLWCTRCQNPLPIKWVVVRDPKGKLRTEAFFSTNLESTEKQILTWFVLRWNVEVTFEELRAHLGFETQRQWSDKAIARTTPALFGIFSIIVLMANEMLKHDKLNIATCAWYKKKDATFSDIIAYVRKRIWQSRYSTNSTESDDCTYLQDNFLGALIELACYPN